MNNFDKDWKHFETNHDISAERKILESIAFVLVVFCSGLILILVSEL